MTTGNVCFRLSNRCVRLSIHHANRPISLQLFALLRQITHVIDTLVWREIFGMVACIINHTFGGWAAVKKSLSLQSIFHSLSLGARLSLRRTLTTQYIFDARPTAFLASQGFQTRRRYNDCDWATDPVLGYSPSFPSSPPWSGSPPWEQLGSGTVAALPVKWTGWNIHRPG